MSDAQGPQTQNMAALPQRGDTPSTVPGVPAVPSPATRDPRRSPLARFFGVVARPQSWLNLFYLGLSFPLGLFYFVFLTVCLSVGIGLVIIWVGIFVLGLTAACWWAFAAFERSLADGLLGTQLAPSPQPWRRAEGTWPRIKAHFTSSATWKDLAFLFVKFPLGLLSFVVVVSLGATSLALLTAPIYYRYIESTDGHGIVHHGLNFGVWWMDRLWQTLLLVPLGLLLAVVSFHAFNGLAAMWRGVARGLLTPDDTPRPAPAAAAAGPAAPPPPVPPATPQPPAQPAGWPAYPGYPTQPGAPGAGEPPAPTGAPVGQSPYGWLYYPQAPYPPQPTYPPQSPYRPQPTQPPEPQTGAPWSSGPWSGTPWAQGPPMFAPPQAAAPATGPPGAGDAAAPVTPAAAPPATAEAAIPAAADATKAAADDATKAETAAPGPDIGASAPESADPATEVAGQDTLANGESPSQEEQP